MPDSVTFWLVAQVILLACLLGGVVFLAMRLKSSLDRATALLEEVRELMQQDVKPAIAEARRAIARAEEAAVAATGTLKAAGPVVDTASQVASVLLKSVSPLWLEMAKLALGIFGVVRGKRKKSDKTELQEGEKHDVA
jgi:hypothetical protein